MNTRPNRMQADVTVELFRNRERSFWQSRAMLRDPPVLVDLHMLATDVRRTWPT